jgi:hypothetical protein
MYRVKGELFSSPLREALARFLLCRFNSARTFFDGALAGWVELVNTTPVTHSEKSSCCNVSVNGRRLRVLPCPWRAPPARGWLRIRRAGWAGKRICRRGIRIGTLSSTDCAPCWIRIRNRIDWPRNILSERIFHDQAAQRFQALKVWIGAQPDFNSVASFDCSLQDFRDCRRLYCGLRRLT